MRQVLIDLLVSLANAKTLLEVNIAAGVALQRLTGEEDVVDGPEVGQPPRP